MELEQIQQMDSGALLENLDELIQQTFVIEQDYKDLRDTFNDVIEMQSNALWILDPQDSIYLQNSKAKDRSALFKTLHFDEKEYEKNFEQASFLIKINIAPDHKKIVSATDITVQKRKEALATMGQMAAHLSHEIRNPIGSISLLTSTLLKRVKVENKPVVFEIQKAIYRIERIIKATLMFSKGVETQKSLMRFKNLEQELQTAVSYYSYTKEINFDFVFPDFEVVADFELLLMVFTNFVFNAIDAIEENDEDAGLISIRCTKKEEQYCFTILDSGVAFENTSTLFEAFESSKEKGNGLGLVLSKQIIEEHGGTIDIVNDTDKGFTLCIQKEDI